MRATVRAAGITSKRRTRTGIVTTRVGALALSVGVATLAGAFFAGPAAADEEERGRNDPAVCDEVPENPVCEAPDPDESETGNPDVTETATEEPDNEPSNAHTDSGEDGGNGGGGGNKGGGNKGNGGNNSGGSGGGSGNDGPQLPVTGAEVGLLAGTGAALVGGGAAMVLVARRRRAAMADDAQVADDES